MSKGVNIIPDELKLFLCVFFRCLEWRVFRILFTYLFICLFVCLFVYLFIYLFICLFVCLFIYLFIYLFICLFIFIVKTVNGSLRVCCEPHLRRLSKLWMRLCKLQ